MQFESEPWLISDVVRLKARIDPRPQWQRGESWRMDKKQLLIDSVLAGFDIPKIYLWKINGNLLFDYAVADGQQRLLSIWGFVEGGFSLPASSNSLWAGAKYGDLDPSLKSRIDSFKLIVTVVDANDEEIRELFARLQKGVQLTAPQIRNSMASDLGTVIRDLALTHPFFSVSTFSAEGFMRDDFLAHIFALEIHGLKQDVKAPNLSRMYQAYNKSESIDDETVKKIVKVLNQLKEIQEVIPKVINTKWGGVDLYGYLSIGLNGKVQASDIQKIAQKYRDFESKRKQFVGNPSLLISSESPNKDPELYKYIQAFKTETGLAKSLKIRHDALSSALTK